MRLNPIVWGIVWTFSTPSMKRRIVRNFIHALLLAIFLGGTFLGVTAQDIQGQVNQINERVRHLEIRAATADEQRLANARQLGTLAKLIEQSESHKVTERESRNTQVWTLFIGIVLIIAQNVFGPTLGLKRNDG